MELPKRILVPTDFSETSDKALDYAVDLATLLKGSITVMHAYEIPIVGFPDGAIIASAEIASKLLDSVQAAMDATIAKRKNKGVPLQPVIRQDVPYRAINAVADEMKADLIIIGTHGRRGISRALLGSVAENVIRTATRPVLTIHGPRE
jgi:nucleotide-binding universal stress UspA family protein